MLSFCVPFLGGDFQVVLGDPLRLACKQKFSFQKATESYLTAK